MRANTCDGENSGPDQNTDVQTTPAHQPRHVARHRRNDVEAAHSAPRRGERRM